jgi:hypothetical protein
VSSLNAATSAKSAYNNGNVNNNAYPAQSQSQYGNNQPLSYHSNQQPPPPYGSLSNQPPPSYGINSHQQPPSYGSHQPRPSYGTTSHQPPPSYGSNQQQPPSYGSNQQPPSNGSIHQPPPAYGSTSNTSSYTASKPTLETKPVVKRIYDNIDIPDSFPELKTLTEDQLGKLMKDSVAFKTHVQAIAPVGQIRQILKELKEVNDKQITKNLTMVIIYIYISLYCFVLINSFLYILRRWMK